MPRLRPLLLALLVLFTGLGSSVAGPLDIDLVSEVKTIQPGKSFLVGLSLKHRKGYHTYWKFPGIVGVPVSMEWKLPPGWKASPILWPQPDQVFMFKIRAQGYRRDLVLPIQLTPPADLKLDEKITLHGVAAWMCCGRDCNPDFAKLYLTLPVSQEPKGDDRWSAAFAQARTETPQPLGKGWSTSATRGKEHVTLRLTAKTEAARAQLALIQEALFFTDDGYIHSDKDQKVTKNGNHTLTLTLPLSQYYDKKTPAHLNGVLRSPQGWGSTNASQSVLIHAPFS